MAMKRRPCGKFVREEMKNETKLRYPFRDVVALDQHYE
jgi:hypothetical protein